jgi:hypothetical protein
MIDAREVKQQLKLIKEMASDKDEKVKAKAAPAYQRLQNIVFDDLSKTGDQRVRLIMKLMFEFKL